jgi:hypothetical protein
MFSLAADPTAKITIPQPIIDNVVGIYPKMSRSKIIP